MSLRDLERRPLSAVIRMMSSVATLQWRTLIGQRFIIGIVSSVGVLKMPFICILLEREGDELM